ncbi:MAG: enolase C-terminal domain-like protein [Betaproteobacteria bacterium]|jgi:hypothetical protein
MKITEIKLQRLNLPLSVPYKVAHRTHLSFTPFVVRMHSGNDHVGWGEVYISPGYTEETEKGAWQFCQSAAQSSVGQEAAHIRTRVMEKAADSPGAASALLTALDMLEQHPLLQIKTSTRVPLLAPCQGSEPEEVQREVDRLIKEGFKTLKVKVGFDVEKDLARLRLIQKTVGNRATIRLDANRGYNQAQGCAFASQIDPQGIELFEQPCGSHEWESNAAVAKVSTVPVMLDESIYDERDIDRAATMPGVGFVKLKLKKMGSIDMLHSALQKIRNLGMEPVLGDGVSMEIGCWMEACVARSTITNAGEMNGFLKPKTRILANPLIFAQGAIELPAHYWPKLNEELFHQHMIQEEIFR